jgi:glutathione S-transferase
MGTRPYWAGETFTLVDIFALPYAAKLYAAGHGDLIDSRPNLAAWYKRASQRECWQKALAASK